MSAMFNSIKFVLKCAAKFENRLTNKNFMDFQNFCCLILARKYFTLSFNTKNNPEKCILTGQF